ncbi:MAG: HNH endonuclease [Actinobacteria bacterium]|nr:HNH endonuclease [Actinomycetota bacterium]
MACGSTDNIHVDHIKPRSAYPGLSFDEDNLQVLCQSCNSRKGAIRFTDYRPKENAAD